ncbi:MAG: divalent metal cation transporter [Balneolales bacterium]
MAQQENNFEEESRMLEEVQGKNFITRYKTYFKLSGPGWLQSALTLGGGSLTGSLYLGVMTGFSMLWLQPVAMLFGIIMLFAIGYVTLASNQRPFHAINEHINPMLGWGWAVGSILSCVVWIMPQFALGTAVVQQNLLPGVFGAASPLGGFVSKLIIAAILLSITLSIAWNYGKGTRGVRLFETVLKVLVAIVVVSFLGVVFRLMFVGDSIEWGAVFKGLIPNPALIFRPADGLMPMLDQLSATSAAYWSDLIVGKQQEVMAAALSSAVGINATFLFAYSMLRRKWGTEYQGMLKFELGIGMLIPFMLATSCIIIASASQFHTVPHAVFTERGEVDWEPDQTQLNQYNQMLENRVLHEYGDAGLSGQQISGLAEELSEGDHLVAATLVTRDAFDLASALQPLLGGIFSGLIFGIGVLGMAVSTITLHMTIAGFVICEVLKLPYESWAYRAGTLIPACGVLGVFFWDQALFWLAIPTSVITLMLLPIAYVAFLLMINNKAIMGKHRPAGGRRILWNVLMLSVILLVGSASMYMLWQYAGWWGMGVLGLFLTGIAVTDWQKRKKNMIHEQSTSK